ncbi:MAG: FMN-binding protein [Desulfatiglans sp.]|jgi:electron transport complex protein RnfG|nr:FMN-binding protein [Desulfatiglans sp.]
MGSFKNNNLLQAWLVLLLSIFFSVTLAAVHIRLSPVIEENKTRETMERIPALITGESNTDSSSRPFTIKQRSILAEKKGIVKSYTVYDAIDNTGNVAGHVVKASGQGYADKIELLIGLDATAKTITGLFILDQKETPGLGNKIIEDAWRNQFNGKSSYSPLVAIKGKSVNENEIDAVSGATISSRSVTDIINSAIGDVKKDITLTPESNNMENR